MSPSGNKIDEHFQKKSIKKKLFSAYRPLHQQLVLVST
jgi:hypothetical protein